MAVNPLAPDTDCASVGEQEANGFLFQLGRCDDGQQVPRSILFHLERTERHIIYASID